MKKEKNVKAYQRRTKSGKMVTVKAHTAKYDAAEEALKEAAKRKGAGGELDALKKIKESELCEGCAFTQAEFAEWYEGTGSAADKKVEKALRKSLGKKAYEALSDLAADNYKKGGANSFFKKNVNTPTEKASSEYGAPPKHLGMTQQEWNDWMDGGAGYKKADKKAKNHLVSLYGKEGAKYIQQKYESDGSNRYIDIVSSATADKKLLSEISKSKGASSSSEDFQVSESTLKKLDRKIASAEKDVKVVKGWNSSSIGAMEILKLRKKELNDLKRAKTYLEKGERQKAEKILTEHGFNMKDFHSKSKTKPAKGGYGSAPKTEPAPTDHGNSKKNAADAARRGVVTKEQADAIGGKPKKVVSEEAKKTKSKGFSVKEYRTQISSMTPTQLKKELQGLIDKNGGTINRGNSTGKKISEILKLQKAQKLSKPFKGSK